MNESNTANTQDRASTSAPVVLPPPPSSSSSSSRSTSRGASRGNEVGKSSGRLSSGLTSMGQHFMTSKHEVSGGGGPGFFGETDGYYLH